MLFLIYLLVVNVMAFCLYFIDKRRARKSQYRISESALLLIAFLGGALGAALGMWGCHHKTRKAKFRYGVPLMLLCQLIVCVIAGGALYLLQYSLNPAGRAERDAGSMAFLDEYYPGTSEWIDSMSRAGALRDTFIVNRGTKLHAYYAQHPQAKGTALLAHGYTDNALRMMMLGKLYYDTLQFNILVPDHARHGMSDGEAIQMGWYDRLNFERWISIADSLWAPAPIYLHGISMGGATVMMCSGDALPARVCGIIDDCGYTSVWDEFSGEIKNQFGLPVHPLMDVASWFCQLKYGWNFREASALAQVEHSTLPMLFIHGDADTFVPTAMVYQLYEAKKQGHRQLWIAPGTAHALAYHDYPQEYRRQLEAFLQSTATPIR